MEGFSSLSLSLIALGAALMLVCIFKYKKTMRLTGELFQVENATIFTLARQAELRDKETGNHLKRCREYVQSELGASILNEAEAKLEFRSFLTIARKITLAHHERWDGKGYPFGMRGDEIPLSARIMALADVYDALTSRRCYKSAISHEETVSSIREERGKHFDPDVCDAFLRREKEFFEVSNKCRSEYLVEE